MLSFVKFVSFCFITGFAFVLQRLRAKPIPLKMHASKGSPCGRAPAIAGERVLCAQLSPLRRLRRHRLAAARSRSGSDTTPWCHSLPSRRFATQRARLLVSPIITQIGRENNVSAENYVSRTVEDAGPDNFVNILMRISLMDCFFVRYFMYSV